MPSVARRYGPGGTGSTAPFERPSRATDDALLAPVVLMVSGGADSTALLVLAATSALDIEDGRGRARIARERLHVLHVNHRLRGIDADEDEEFVRDLAARYGIPCTIRRVTARPPAWPTSSRPSSARLARPRASSLPTPPTTARRPS